MYVVHTTSLYSLLGGAKMNVDFWLHGSHGTIYCSLLTHQAEVLLKPVVQRVTAGVIDEDARVEEGAA